MKTNKLLKWLIAFALIFTVYVPLSKQAEAAQTLTATVNIKSGTLNVREKPSTSSKKVGSLKKGAKVTVYAKTKSGWSEIRYNKKKAFVATKYLIFTSTQASYQQDPNKIYVYKYEDGLYTEKSNGKKYTHEYFGKGWLLWTTTMPDKTTYQWYLRETKDGLYTVHPDDPHTHNALIKYPVKVGYSWKILYEGDLVNTYKITAVNKTVKTHAGTFKQVVEVTADEGVKMYYAKNVGLIKTTYKGKTTGELYQLKKK
ncbi:SH3 domain-containing protein [Peribacillus asahii]|uniref:SH3 domain-containing protein n=1 Tax=Peribacillus asahii TaxID=228899 RepID=UPI0020797A08|nr:SH3 domain-containing protein [Peribacillus asahii]USK71182.1 SH3 domain-containing protein [Peribacillus asahii]